LAVALAARVIAAPLVTVTGGSVISTLPELWTPSLKLLLV
jgi:hypothetical protein